MYVLDDAVVRHTLPDIAVFDDALPIIETTPTASQSSFTIIFGAEVKPIADGMDRDHVLLYKAPAVSVADTVTVLLYHASIFPLFHLRYSQLPDVPCSIIKSTI